MATQFATIDEYISRLPDDVATLLEEVRRTIHEAVPGAGETISYQMPTITLGGRSLLYFAGWKHHVALYPAPAATGELEAELAPFRAATSSLRFPINRPIPYDLIARLMPLYVAQRESWD